MFTLIVMGVSTFLIGLLPTYEHIGFWTVFLLLWTTFVLLAGGEFGFGVGWRTAGGWMGLATGLGALYVSFAEITNTTFDRTVVPPGRAILPWRPMAARACARPSLARADVGSSASASANRRPRSGSKPAAGRTRDSRTWMNRRG